MTRVFGIDEIHGGSGTNWILYDDFGQGKDTLPSFDVAGDDRLTFELTSFFGGSLVITETSGGAITGIQTISATTTTTASQVGGGFTFSTTPGFNLESALSSFLVGLTGAPITGGTPTTYYAFAINGAGTMLAIGFAFDTDGDGTIESAFASSIALGTPAGAFDVNGPGGDAFAFL